MKLPVLFTQLSIAAVITVVMGVQYMNVQQSYRSGANDPQIQMAEDITTDIKQGHSIGPHLKDDTVDLSKSLSPFFILYDNNGKPIQSSALLNGQIPQLPAGVLDYAKVHDDDRITWQPGPGVRLATVIKRTGASPVAFVAVGRSLKEVEVRESNLRTTVASGWIVCMMIIGITAIWQLIQRTKLVTQSQLA
jgi:hypothetical protein